MLRGRRCRRCSCAAMLGAFTLALMQLCAAAQDPLAPGDCDDAAAAVTFARERRQRGLFSRPRRAVAWDPPPEARVGDDLMQQRVRAAFLHAWHGYSKYAWGHDDLKPVSGKPAQSGVADGMGLTLVDSLDTMLLMGLHAEFNRSLAWVSSSLKFGGQEGVSVFESTIRVIGGLLSAFELSRQVPELRGRTDVLLRRADELGSKLLPAFYGSKSGIPFATVGLRSGRTSNPDWAHGATCVAEAASVQLELRALARHTGKLEYEVVASRVMDHLRRMPRPSGLPDGLYPTFIHPKDGAFSSRSITLGARADSAYEYLLKQWLLGGRTEARMRRMYETSVAAISKHLVRVGGAERCGNCTYIGSWDYSADVYVHQMDHLVCFLPGVLALGAEGATEGAHLDLAERLMRTCYRMYQDTTTHLAGEIADLSGDRSRVLPKSNARHCLLRPEVVESLFILWRRTGKAVYREWGGKIFDAIERHAKVEGGYSGVKDVMAEAVAHDDTMHSFVLAETLKYLYLLFADASLLPLHRVVFNTEAHPIRLHGDYEWGAEYGPLPDYACRPRDATTAARGLWRRVRARAERLAELSSETAGAGRRMAKLLSVSPGSWWRSSTSSKPLVEP